LQTLPSLHEVLLATATVWQPVDGLQVSVVQALPSLQLRAAPGVHVPPWQVSAPLHWSPSLHAVPLVTGTVWHPVAASQLSTVQALPSLQVRADPAVHVPLWQVSEPLQTFASLQDVPLATGTVSHPMAGSQLSVVQTFPSLQVRAAPAVHMPP